MLYLAVVWHWWIGFFLAIGAVLAVIGVIAGYLMKVENPRYKRRK